MTTDLFYADTIKFARWQFVIFSSNRGVRLIDLHGTPPAELATQLRGRIIVGENAEAVHQLAEYFSGVRKVFDLPLDLHGTPFQVEVWVELLHVSYGSTISYRELATRLGRPQAARAVGGAVRANPIPIIIPCHRVIGKNGDLVGFGGGLDLKRQLLVHEGALPS